MEYTANEMMICQAARQLQDGEVVFVGIGLPNLACNLARRTHAPELVLIYESGTIGSVPERVPVSIGDPALVAGAQSVCSSFEVFYHYLQAGRIDVGFLQGAQIDRFGNLNTTVIGDYHKPKVRLPGSGGACEIALHAQKVLIIARQSARVFPEKLDFLTSAGHLDGTGGRQRLGVEGRGPVMVITDLACYAFDEGEMILTSMHPGTSLDVVEKNLGWKPKVATSVATTEAPSEEEIRLLREELDPQNLYI